MKKTYFIIEWRYDDRAWQRSNQVTREFVLRSEASREAERLQKQSPNYDYRVTEMRRQDVVVGHTRVPKTSKVTLKPNTIRVNGDEAEGKIEWLAGGTGYKLHLDLACGDHVEVEFSMGLLALAVNEAQERAGVHKNRRWSRKDGTVYRD